MVRDCETCIYYKIEGKWTKDGQLMKLCVNGEKPDQFCEYEEDVLAKPSDTGVSTFPEYSI